MIVKENIIMGQKRFIKSYSDLGMMIERDGVKYDSAIDLIELDFQYTETNIPVKEGK